MEKLKLTEDLKKVLEEKCSEWRFYNQVVYLQADSNKNIAESISKILEENQEFSIACMSSRTKDEKEEATIVFRQTGFTGG